MHNNGYAPSGPPDRGISNRLKQGRIPWLVVCALGLTMTKVSIYSKDRKPAVGLKESIPAG